MTKKTKQAPSMIDETPKLLTKPKLTKSELAAGRKRLKELNQAWLKHGEEHKSEESVAESIGTFSSSSLETLPPRHPNPVYSSESEDGDIFNRKPPVKKKPVRKPKKPRVPLATNQTEEEPSTGSIGDLMSLGLLAPGIPDAERDSILKGADSGKKEKDRSRHKPAGGRNDQLAVRRSTRASKAAQDSSRSIEDKRHKGKEVGNPGLGKRKLTPADKKDFVPESEADSVSQKAGNKGKRKSK